MSRTLYLCACGEYYPDEDWHPIENHQKGCAAFQKAKQDAKLAKLNEMDEHARDKAKKVIDRLADNEAFGLTGEAYFYVKKGLLVAIKEVAKEFEIKL